MVEERVVYPHHGILLTIKSYTFLTNPKTLVDIQRIVFREKEPNPKLTNIGFLLPSFEMAKFYKWRCFRSFHRLGMGKHSRREVHVVME